MRHRWFVGLVFLPLMVGGCGLFSDFQASFVVVPSASDSLVPDSLRAVYRVDAARLALRFLIARDDPARDEVLLPDALTRTLYDVLILVHNATGLDARDSVVRQYAVHAFPNPPVDTLPSTTTRRCSRCERATRSTRMPSHACSRACRASSGRRGTARSATATISRPGWRTARGWWNTASASGTALRDARVATAGRFRCSPTAGFGSPDLPGSPSVPVEL